MSDAKVFEGNDDEDEVDPDSTYPPNREVVTQNYDLVVSSLVEQISSGDIRLTPSFQRGYVWPRKLASQLIESIILNIPIPPCYLAQNDDFVLDVVDGQQRLSSIKSYLGNEFPLRSMSVLNELNGLRFHELNPKIQRQIKTHTMRCVTITNRSHPDVRFEIFERLNTTTSALTPQELRNCIYRGAFNDMLKDVASSDRWLAMLGRRSADRRMRGEEMVLRYFAFQKLGLETYRTPMKNWLNDAAQWGKDQSNEDVRALRLEWENMLGVCSVWFDDRECFRRPGGKLVNRALFDLVTNLAARADLDNAPNHRAAVRASIENIFRNEEFNDLVERAVDHKKRTQRRFQLWNEEFSWF